MSATCPTCGSDRPEVRVFYLPQLGRPVIRNCDNDSFHSPKPARRRKVREWLVSGWWVFMHDDGDPCIEAGSVQPDSTPSSRPISIHRPKCMFGGRWVRLVREVQQPRRARRGKS